MKLVALCLLMINIAYFSYQHFGPEEVVTTPRTGREMGNIKLLSELAPDAKQLAMSAVVDNPVRDSEDPVSSEACQGIGPFADVFNGQNALEQINAIGIEGSLKAIDVATGENDYRVLIPPAPSAEEAFRKLRELQASDVDSYVITQGNQALGISLGVFSTQSGASVLQSRLASIGYETEILEIERQSRSYWIEMNSSQFALLGQANWLANREGLGSREMICTESQE